MPPTRKESGATAQRAASAWQLEVVPDRQARVGLVQGVEVQPRCATLQQGLAHFADDLLAEGLDADVIAVGFQLLAYPALSSAAASA